MGRIDRVNQAVKEEVSVIIHRELKDPRLGFVTITEVKVSRDLQHAKVYFSVLGDEEKIKQAQEGFNSARGFIRKLIGQRVRMRYTPEIDFIYDKSIQYGAQIERALGRIKNGIPDDYPSD